LVGRSQGKGKKHYQGDREELEDDRLDWEGSQRKEKGKGQGGKDKQRRGQSVPRRLRKSYSGGRSA
jgi:hypothetical protein